MAAGATIVFDNAVTNIGNSYNPRDGIFTCTRTGVYIFHVTFLTKYGSNMIGSLVKNGNRIVTIDANAHLLNSQSVFQSASNLGAVSLVVGDKVWVKAGGSPFHGENLQGDLGTFTGWST